MENNLKSNGYNGLALAYIGDAVYELYIREFVISKGNNKVNNLHKLTTGYTSGVNQARFMHYFLNNNLLSDYEISLYKRGRNSHISTTRRNMDLATYLEATGFEALIGGLYIDNNIARLEEIISIIEKGVDEDDC